MTHPWAIRSIETFLGSPGLGPSNDGIDDGIWMSIKSVVDVANWIRVPVVCVGVFMFQSK